MITRVVPQLLKQIFSGVFTNPFPVAHMPPSLTEALSAPGPGLGQKAPLNPPMPVGERFRGRLAYDREKCVGCRLCLRVCPANAIGFLEESKKIVIHNDRCCFCAQCTEICPPKCLAMSDTHLMSSYNRRENVVTGTGKPA